MKRIKDLVRKGVRALGYDIVTFPPADSLGAHLATLLSRLEINCVLDVGGHVGEYALFLREIGYEGYIISFEPVLANFESMKRRSARDPKWSAWRLALGNREGRMPMNVTCATEFSSFLMPNGYGLDRFGRRSEVERVEIVEVKRLENMFSACIAQIENPRVYVKLDTQGYDIEVLEGAGTHLDDILALQAELSVKPIYANMRGYVESISRMNECGFELTGVFPVSRSSDLELIEFDCVMRRARNVGTEPLSGL